jgi:hypothetical protein
MPAFASAGAWSNFPVGVIGEQGGTALSATTYLGAGTDTLSGLIDGSVTLPPN